VFGFMICVKEKVAKFKLEEENEDDDDVMNWFIRKQSWLKFVLIIDA
jgi:hypothetical protein